MQELKHLGCLRILIAVLLTAVIVVALPCIQTTVAFVADLWGLYCLQWCWTPKMEFSLAL